jgi:hypothetical protein
MVKFVPSGHHHADTFMKQLTGPDLNKDRMFVLGMQIYLVVNERVCVELSWIHTIWDQISREHRNFGRAHLR